MESSSSVGKDPSFPTEAEVESYFTKESWASMTSYEKMSYRNILHNYFKMTSLGLNPVKPSFMSKQSVKTDLKRKANKSSCPTPTMSIRLEETKKLPTTNASTSKVKLPQDEKLFSAASKVMSIRLRNVSNAVLKVYKRCGGNIKSQYAKKKSPRSTVNKSRNIKETSNTTLNAITLKKESGLATAKDRKPQSGDGNEISRKMTVLLDSGNTSTTLGNDEDVILRGEKIGKNSLPSENYRNAKDPVSSCEKKEPNTSKEGGGKKPNVQKKPCRSVQTQTAAPDTSIPSSVLVFVSSTRAKKVEKTLPCPQPKELTPKEVKKMKKLNRWRMKNCINVQTQTAGENQSIEESTLVFIRAFKPKKSKTVEKQSSSAKTDLAKEAQTYLRATEELLLTTITPASSEENEFGFSDHSQSIIDKTERNSVSMKQDISTSATTERLHIESHTTLSEEEDFEFSDPSQSKIDKTERNSVSMKQDISTNATTERLPIESHTTFSEEEDFEFSDPSQLKIDKTERNCVSMKQDISTSATTERLPIESHTTFSEEEDFEFSDPSQLKIDKTERNCVSMKQDISTSATTVRLQIESHTTFSEEEDFEFSDPSQLKIDKTERNSVSMKQDIPTNAATERFHIESHTTVSDEDDFEFSDPSQPKIDSTTINEPNNKKNVDKDESSSFDFLDVSQVVSCKQNNKSDELISKQTSASEAIEQVEHINRKEEVEDVAHQSSSILETERRYPRRSVPVLNYTEAELLADDDYLFCDMCDREYEGDCPLHGPYTIFDDVHVPITGDKNRAERTAPDMLKIAKSMIPGAGSGVWTSLGLPGRVRLGPYQGELSQEPDPQGYSWCILKDRRVDHYISAESSATSNWMRFVNCARHESEQNLMAFQYRGQLYYRTVKLIPPKVELLVWYGKEYAEKLGISLESFRSPDSSHLRNEVFECGKCSLTYTSPLYLEKHQRWCRGKRGALVKVDVANITTDVQSLATVVNGIKSYCCSVCEYKAKYTSQMKLHLLVHTGVKNHTCDVCFKAFSQAFNLNRHRRIHTGEKPFKCDVCSRAFNRLSTLERHKKVHTGEKEFVCSVCHYKTAESGALTKHMRTHTGEKPFSCPHCEYRTNWKSYMKHHITTKHKA